MSSMKKILVVDDDQDIRELISLILDVEGYDVFSLDNGHEVVTTVAEKSPDVILLDVRLGDTDGRDICKVLKNQPETSYIPIIMVSATHGRHTMHEKKCGADDYIAKPFDMDELIAQVKKYAA